jgi:rhodanese-related sulfurtransferase
MIGTLAIEGVDQAGRIGRHRGNGDGMAGEICELDLVEPMFHRTRLILVCTALGAAALFSRLVAADVPSLDPAAAAARVAAGRAILVDVREAAEWERTGVVATAHLLALSDLRGGRAQWSAFLEANRDKELILYCRTGNRSGQAASLLAAEGFRTANAGGLSAWIAAGQKTRTPAEPRQTPEAIRAPQPAGG